MVTHDSFRQTQWLYAVGDVVSDASKPYEDWCIEDHNAAKALDVRFAADRSSVSERAYKAAWKWCPNPEFCALFSDDVSTIYSLLMITGNQLRPFTADRADWYVRGRVAWGYIGIYPGGQWIVL